MKDKKNSEVGFQIVGIELLESSLYTPKMIPKQETTFQFEINIEYKLNTDKKLVIVVCSISVFDENKEQILGMLKSSCIFLVETLSSYIDPETKSLELPDPFLITLNTISLSTTRGLMFSFFRGTFLHKALLPIVNPGSLVKNEPS